MKLNITSIDKVLKNQEVEITPTNLVDAPHSWKERKRTNGRLWIQSYIVTINGQSHKIHRLSSEGAPHVAIETAIDNQVFKNQKEAAQYLLEVTK